MNRESIEVHKELILAYIEGAEIQIYSTGKWIDISCPSFDACVKYRIKPKKRTP